MSAACALNQSSDSQQLGRYLGFRLRCLDVDGSTTPHPAAGALQDVTARLHHGSSPLQSPLDVAVTRGRAASGASPTNERRVTSSWQPVKRNDAENCNNVLNSRPTDEPRVTFDPHQLLTRPTTRPIDSRTADVHVNNK